MDLSEFPLWGDTLRREILQQMVADSVPAARVWLSLIEKGAPDGCAVLVSSHRVLKSDELLPDVQRVLKNSKNSKVLDELVRALEGR